MSNKDALTDFLKIYKDKYYNLEKHESKLVAEFLNQPAATLINEYFES